MDSAGYLNKNHSCLFCLFGLILYVPVNIFQSCLDGMDIVAVLTLALNSGPYDGFLFYVII